MKNALIHFLCGEFPHSVIQVRRFPVGTVDCYKRLDIGNGAKKKTEMYKKGGRVQVQYMKYCWFSQDATKIQTTKLSIFYFHDVLEQLKINFHTNFRFKRVVGFVIEYA